MMTRLQNRCGKDGSRISTDRGPKAENAVSAVSAGVMVPGCEMDSEKEARMGLGRDVAASGEVASLRGDAVPHASSTDVDQGSVESEALRLDRGSFYRENVDRARRIAWRLVGGDAAAADDVVQDAFVKAFRSMDSFRAESSVDTWFFRIVTNEAKNYRRWKGVRILWNTLWSDETPDPAARSLPDLGLQGELIRAMESLAQGQREAFVLVRLEDLSLREAAAVLGVGEGTVKTQLSRATKKLREELQPVWEEFTR
jgi:RNA polymerase sigma-70 factor (ECF subfamily)